MLFDSSNAGYMYVELLTPHASFSEAGAPIQENLLEVYWSEHKE